MVRKMVALTAMSETFYSKFISCSTVRDILWQSRDILLPKLPFAYSFYNAIMTTEENSTPLHILLLISTIFRLFYCFLLT